MMKRATALANSYRGACIRIAKAGPDNVDLAMSVYFVQQWQEVNRDLRAKEAVKSKVVFKMKKA